MEYLSVREAVETVQIERGLTDETVREILWDLLDEDFTPEHVEEYFLAWLNGPRGDGT